MLQPMLKRSVLRLKKEERNPSLKLAVQSVCPEQHIKGKPDVLQAKP